MVKKSHKISSSDSKLITLKLEEKCRLDKQEGLEETKFRKEGSIKHLGITLTTPPTIQHTDLLHFIAKKERKVLELREELKRNEEELSLLKKKWETIFTNQIINSPESPINNNKDNEDNNNNNNSNNNNNNNAITATNGDRNKQEGNGKENVNVNRVGVGESENNDDNQSDDAEVIRLMNGLSKGIVGVVNGIKNVAESEVTQEKLSKIRTVVADVANYESVKQTKKMTFDFTSQAFDNISKGFSSIAQSETIRNARRRTLETVYQLNEVLAPIPPPSITSNNSVYASSPTSTSPPPLPPTSTFSSSSSPSIFSSSSSSSSSSPSSTTSTNPNSPKTPIQQTWPQTSQNFDAFSIQNSKQSDEIIPSSSPTTKGEENGDYNEESLYLFNELF